MAAIFGFVCHARAAREKRVHLGQVRLRAGMLRGYRIGGRSSGATSRLACAARAAAAPSACGRVRESTSASGECSHGVMGTLSASRADDVHGQVRGVSRAEPGLLPLPLLP